VYALASCGASVVLANRTLERARELARWFGKMGMEISVVSMGELRGVVYGVDIIVNATSVGLHDDSSPIEDVGSSRLVVDLVYRRFGETPLVRLARSRGCEVVDGLVVLVHQGVHSFRIWTGVEVSRDEVDWLLGMLRRGLIQPPGPVPDAP
jgi:shikimate dehydrogenase